MEFGFYLNKLGLGDPKQKKKNKKKPNVYKAAAVTHPHYCPSPAGAHSSKDAVPRTKPCLILGQAQSPPSPAPTARTRACRREKGRIVIKKYLFASLMSIWLVQGLERYLCLFCRGAAVPLCHSIASPQEQPSALHHHLLFLLPCAILRPRRLFSCINCRQKTHPAPQ